MFTIVFGCVILYIIASYYAVYKDLKKSAGPAGLGWLMLPFAPLVGPIYIASAIKEGVQDFIYRFRK